ncbi:Molybdopterin oxidoreductase subunit, predicted; chaperone protein HtpG [hydrothermal vent metagenome]|uniref:Molybdopterin oxidoreductase subunit, predicted chaperone protein HtpG n=1 Tax=hydrothermal vent metagenome TaxID=652676 RepID=A0A3B1DF88_9ZZZZ
MQKRVMTIILCVGLFFSLIVFGASVGKVRLPDNQQGYSPKQPIDYSHQLHAGKLKMDCQFCHTAAATSRHAGIPSSDVCMKCHKIVTASYDVLQEEIQKAEKEKRKPKRIISAELRKLYDSLGLNDELKLKKDATPKSIEWIRVHNLPDYAYFNHSAHVAVGVSCQKCHGPIESMERVRQVETLSMGWCINCHRQSNKTGINGRAVNAKTNCATCHY